MVSMKNRPMHDTVPRQAPSHPRWSISMVLAVLFVLAQVSPLISIVGHGFRLSWFMYGLWVIFAVFTNAPARQRMLREASARRFELLAFAGWGLVILLNLLLGRSYSGSRHLMGVVNLGMIISLEMYYTAQEDNRGRAISSASFALLGFEALRSLPTLWLEPMLARQVMLLDASFYLSSMAAYASVGEYGVYTAHAIAMPFLLAVALTQSGLRRMAMLISCGAIAFAVSLATFLGALLLMVTGFLLLALLTIRLQRNTMRFLFIFVLIGLLAAGIWSFWLRDSLQAGPLLDKFLQLVTSISESGLVEGDSTNRAWLGQYSIATFFAHPLFGVGSVTGSLNPLLITMVGGHSSWLDIPAQYGLVGLLCYLGFLLSAVSRALAASRSDRTNVVSIARIVVCIMFVIGGTYNPVVFLSPIETLFFFLCLTGASAIPSVRQSESGAAQRAGYRTVSSAFQASRKT